MIRPIISTTKNKNKYLFMKFFRQETHSNVTELNCGSNFHCKVEDICIPMEEKCDETWDCIDGSDEDGCPDKPMICEDSNKQWACLDKSHCIPITWKCDKESDCPDGSDELNCPN